MADDTAALPGGRRLGGPAPDAPPAEPAPPPGGAVFDMPAGLGFDPPLDGGESDRPARGTVGDRPADGQPVDSGTVDVDGGRTSIRSPRGIQQPAGVAADATPAPRTGVLRTGALSMVALAALGLTRLIHGSLVSRATDPQVYGRVGVLIAMATIASLLLPAGAASAAAKYIPFLHGSGDAAAARAAHRFLWWVSLASALLLGGVTAAAGWAVLSLTVGQTVQLAALTVTFSLYSVDKSTLYGWQRVAAYVRLELGTCTLAVLATVVVVVVGSDAYLLPLALGYGLFSSVTRLLLRREVGERAPRGTLVGLPRGEIVGYVLLACLGTLASNGFLQGTQLLAARFATAAEVGYFTAAVALVTPMYFLPRALGLALFPAMARSHGAGDLAAVRRQADMSTRVLLVLLAPVFAAGILLAREVLALFGGAQFTAGAPVLQLMLAATYLAVCAVAAVNALSSGHGWQLRTPVLSGVAGCVCGLVVVAALGGSWGAAGVGIGYLCGTAVTAGGPLITVWRRYRMPWGTPAAGGLGTVTVALLTGLAVARLDGPAAQIPLDVGLAVAVVLASLVTQWAGIRALLEHTPVGRRLVDSPVWERSRRR